jgi:hypothetical protein
MDYSGLPDQNYRHVNLVSLPSWEVRQFWLTLAVVLGLLALLWAYRCASDGAAYSIFFCSLLIIQPNVRGTIYVALLWPALYAGVVLTDQKTPPCARWALMGAAALAVLKPLVPGAASQRLAQVLGMDFFGVLLPLTIVHLSCSSWGLLSPLRLAAPFNDDLRLRRLICGEASPVRNTRPEQPPLRRLEG